MWIHHERIINRSYREISRPYFELWIYRIKLGHTLWKLNIKSSSQTCKLTSDHYQVRVTQEMLLILYP